MFKVGEKISLLYEKVDGVITAINGNVISIKDTHGFIRDLQVNEIAKIRGDYKNSKQMKIPAKPGENTELKHNTLKIRSDESPKKLNVWEVDLHIEELTESKAHMTNNEIVAKQLSTFKSHYKKAEANHISKLIVIHGVGLGVLKAEIHNFLNKQKGSEYYDADFREYGKGATCVEFNYNRKR